jgi:membrane-bound inhibitor of C-type lysozyme
MRQRFLRPVLVATALASSACSRPLPTTTFLCAGGDSIVVAIGPRFAELRLPPDRTVRLYTEPAASGAKYSDGRYTLHTKGGEALLEQGGDVVLRDCRTAAAIPVAESDAALTPVLAKAIADSIDSLTAPREPETRTLQPEAAGWNPRVLSLWADSGRPVKLSVTDPAAVGARDGVTRYYFVAGRLEVVRGPVSQYVFRDTTLILWTTDSLQQIADIPLRDMVARQNFVLGEVRQYLAMFGLEP